MSGLYLISYSSLIGLHSFAHHSYIIPLLTCLVLIVVSGLSISLYRCVVDHVSVTNGWKHHPANNLNDNGTDSSSFSSIVLSYFKGQRSSLLNCLSKSIAILLALILILCISKICVQSMDMSHITQYTQYLLLFFECGTIFSSLIIVSVLYTVCYWLWTVISSEIFPYRVRTRAGCVKSVVYYGSIWILYVIYSINSSSITSVYAQVHSMVIVVTDSRLLSTIYSYVCYCIVSAMIVLLIVLYILVDRFVPETSGKFVNMLSYICSILAEFM